MDVPIKAVVGPFTYEVAFDAERSYEYGNMGVHISKSRKILLDPMQSKTEMPQTLIHELLHAIGDVWEIKEIREHTLNDKQEHTDKINLMATALVQFIRDNPKIIQYLTERE